MRGVDQGVIVLGELLPSALMTSAPGGENASSSRSASRSPSTEDNGDAAKKRPVGLAGCPVHLLPSQADAAAAAGDDDHESGLRSHLVGGAGYLVAVAGLHLVFECVALPAPGLTVVAAGCPTHLVVVTPRQSETEGGRR